MDMIYSHNRVPANNPMNGFDGSGDSPYDVLSISEAVLFGQFAANVVQHCNSSFYRSKQREVEEIKGASKSQIINLLT